MSILIDEKTKVIVQGLSGRIGQFHTQEMIEAGTRVVACVTPGKGGSTILNRPIFNTVGEAIEATDAEASLLFVPSAFAADATISAFGESAQEKVELLSAVGITVAPNPSAMGATMAEVLDGRCAA